MYTIDFFKLRNEIDRVYNEHYAQAESQAIHDFYRAVKRRIRRYTSFSTPEIIRVRFIRNSRKEWVAYMFMVFANRKWEMSVKIPNEIFNPDCISAEVVK